MPNVGPFEIAIVLVLVLIIFGPKRLPELGHSLGKGIREFKGSITGENDEPPKPPAITQAPEGTATPVAAEPSSENKPSETSTGS